MPMRPAACWPPPCRRIPAAQPPQILREFLEQYGQPEARAVYAQLLAQLRRAGGAAEAAEIAHRLVILDLLAGDGEALTRDRESYRAITGKALPFSSSEPREACLPSHTRTDAIVRANGRHCARGGARGRAAALARNVVTNGYQASRSNETLEQTEYLKLLHRYLAQAHELEKLAGAQYAIQVPNCDSPNAGDLCASSVSACAAGAARRWCWRR